MTTTERARKAYGEIVKAGGIIQPWHTEQDAYAFIIRRSLRSRFAVAGVGDTEHEALENGLRAWIGWAGRC